MLYADTVDGDGVLTRNPLPFAYAAAWASALNYQLVAMSDSLALYAPRGAHAQRKYYTPQIDAQVSYLKLRTPVSSFALYFHEEPIRGGVSVAAGMWGEPIPEETFQTLLLAVRDLPYSARAIEKLIEKSDWLDLNPMFRGLPSMDGKHTSADQIEAGPQIERPANWDW